MPPLTGAITGTYAPAQPAPNIVVPVAPSSTWTVATPHPTTIVNLPQVMPSIDGTVATANAPNISGAVGTVPTLPQSQLPGGPTNSITTLFTSNNNGSAGRR